MAKHTPPAEQQRLVARWRQSDQSQSAFARSMGVHPNTFATWIRRHPAEPTALVPSPGAFIDVTPSPIPEALSVRLGLHGQPAFELRFDTLPPPAWFAAVLREASSC
ncbi:MAG: hypothetical protein GY772_00170 [bacterium]|nr:hypothetical protein [bacterium]